MLRFAFVLAAAFFAALSAVPAAAATRVLGDLPRAGNRPLESLPGLDTEYGVLRVGDTARLRTIVTRPEGRTGRLPAVLFIQWLSCDTIEQRPDARDGWSVMLRKLLTESGALWMRTEKSGVGDSQGPACDRLDYETELSFHRAALRALRARSDVDAERIVIYGASMGSNYAPLVAAGEKVAGVVVWGGGAFTWFERMLRFERNALELGDTPQGAIADEVNARAAFFARYLLKAESPDEIARTDPELGKVWSRLIGTSRDGHYGRPFAFHQQAQRQNWAGAWERVDAPVLVLYGEYDWFESRDSAALIPEIVNRNRPGTASLQVLPGLDHHFTHFSTARDAFKEERGTPDGGLAAEAILEWLAKIGIRRAKVADALADAESLTLQSYRRARAVLDARVDALGGASVLRSVRSVHREFTDDWGQPNVFCPLRHVVVYEAPLSDAYARQCLALVRATAPGKQSVM